MKLWETKNVDFNEQVESFTVGEDNTLDQRLVEYDVLGSIAHAYMLKQQDFLTDGEFDSLYEGLKKIIELDKMNEFIVKPEDEDVHSKIENYLTDDLGSVGKKIHTGRSRNDQVLVDIRLFTRDKLLKIQEIILDLCTDLQNFAEENGNNKMPGYTHMRKAMPSTIGTWSRSYLESLLDDLKLVESVYEINNQNPLGSAAGYGVPIDIDRDLTKELLGFEGVQSNPLYVQNSRGKIELMVIDALKQIMLDINRFSSDLLLFTMEEFGFFELDDEFCSGSSIMPNKNNPDPLEILRANYGLIMGYSTRTGTIINSLPSGYNRDLQLTKKPLMKSLDLVISSLSVLRTILDGLSINEDDLNKSITPDLFATSRALEMIKEGVPFREAYKEVKSKKKWDDVNTKKYQSGQDKQSHSWIDDGNIKEYIRERSEKLDQRIDYISKIKRRLLEGLKDDNEIST